MLTTLLLVALAIVWGFAIYCVAILATSWRSLFVSPGVSDTTWEYAIKFIAIGLAGLLLSVIALFKGSEWVAAMAAPTVLFGVAGALTVNQGFTVIPAQPISRGVLTFWGERQEYILDEGEHLLPKFWPLNIDVIIENVEAVDFRFVYTGVPCRGEDAPDGSRTIGATVTVEVVGAWEPDYDATIKDEDGHEVHVGASRLMNYQNRGGTDKIRRLLEGIIGQELREYSVSYKWEEFIRLKAPMAATLVSDLTTARPRKLHERGEELPSNVMDIPAKEYADQSKYPIITDPMEYMNDASGDDKETRRRLREMEAFLAQLREGGVGDVPDLGLQFLRFSIPAIEPEGAVKAAADLAAAEKKERERDEQDVDTEIALIGKFVQASNGSMDFNEAAQRLSVNRGRTREIKVSGAHRSTLTDAAAINALAGQDTRKE